MLCFSIVLWLRWLGKPAPKNGRVRRIGCSRCGTICTTPARESDLEVKTDSLGALLEVEVAKICTTPAREHDLEKLTVPEHFWKLKSPKFAPRLRASTIWKSKSLKHQDLGPLFEAQSRFRAAGAGISTQHPHKDR